MLGRGIDQLLPEPVSPELREGYVHDARDYVTLAEEVSGPIQRPVDFRYVWGEALAELDRIAPDVRLINLETTITTSAEFWPGKGIHYRMSPAHLPLLTVAKVDACALANNHTLDFSRSGLDETLARLHQVRLQTAGAGHSLSEARAPARVKNVLVFAMGTDSSGIPEGWGARVDRSGVDLLPDLSGETAARVVSEVRAQKRPGELAVVSIHWGSNWGYAVPEEQVTFAHRLIDGGVDLVHGHSSHHPRPLELYRGKLITYGCGDFINDYEGIEGYESFRSELRLMYFARLRTESGALEQLTLVVLRSSRLRLERAAREDIDWLASTLSDASRSFGVRLVPGDSALQLAPL